MKSLLAISVEGVGTNLLGAYGADNARTPAIDRLASRSLVLDRCFLDSLCPTGQLRSLWTGQHANQQQEDAQSVWTSAKDAGRETILVTDCPQAAKLAGQLGCDAVTLVEVEPGPPAEQTIDCSVVSVFAAAADEMSTASTGCFIWVHSRGLRNPWDAPLDLREDFTDPEDPSPPAESTLPDLSVDATTDPDLAIGWAQVAAAQTTVIDEAIGLLLSAWEMRPTAGHTILVMLGGVPLGEHGHIGWAGTALHECQLACGVMIHADDLLPIGVRRPDLCQLPDLAATVDHLLHSPKIKLFSEPAKPDVGPDASKQTLIHQDSTRWGRSVLHLLDTFPTPSLNQPPTDSLPPAPHGIALTTHHSGSQLTTWIRTPAWTGLFPGETLSAPLGSGDALQAEPRLFVMPDDRWEVCDVARRRIDILELLQESAATFQSALATCQRLQLTTLHCDLTQLMR